MRKLTTLGIVFVLIAVIFAAIPVNVSAEGTITVPDEYPTIQQAIDAANPGDTVYVRAGTYYERLIINKPLTLQGEDRDTTIIDGNAIGNVITLSADYITITGFTIMNSAWMNTWYAGSVIYGSDTSYHKITDNKVTQNSQGIYLQYYSDYNIITNNIVYNVKDTGIILGYGCDNNLINSNEVFECSSNMGIFLAGADNNEISDNYLTKNAEAITLTRSSYNSVTNNMLVDNTWFGITMMDESIYNDISDNSVLNSYYAFQMSGWDPWEGPNNNLVTQNTFENGQYGIYINGAYQNLIYHNNIVNFVKPAIDFGGWYYGPNQWDNGYPDGGNYWSDYTGIDLYNGPNQDLLGSDGIGDTPYDTYYHRNQDRYPLMEPFVSGYTIESVIEDIEEMGLNEGIENSLISKLENAQKSLDKGQDNAAVNQLNAFINEVEAQRGKKLTDAQADELIAAAQSIMGNISQ